MQEDDTQELTLARSSKSDFQDLTKSYKIEILSRSSKTILQVLARSAVGKIKKDQAGLSKIKQDGP